MSAKWISRVAPSALALSALALSALAPVGPAPARVQAATAMGPSEPRRAISMRPFAGISRSRDGRNRRIRIHNQTGWTISALHFSSTGSDAWSGDVLGADARPPGGHWSLDVDDGSGACLYDLRARFMNGQTLVRNGVNVCEIADFYYTR